MADNKKMTRSNNRSWFIFKIIRFPIRVNTQISTKSFFSIAIILTLASCVPTKKLAYLQPENGLKDIHPYDSVTATYTLKKQPYRLKPEDIISLRVASVTEDQFNFIKQYEEDLGIIRKLNQYSEGQPAGPENALGNQQQNIGFGAGSNIIGGGGIPSIILDRMNSGFSIDGQGGLELPQVGRIQLAGLTIPAAEDTVKAHLQGYFETPMVRIQLLNYHFTVLGEVNNEGRYTSFDPEITIFDAITLAGSLTEFADRSNIKVIRSEGDEAKVIYLDMLAEHSLSAENYFLRRGDLIVVSPLSSRTATRYTIPNATRTLGIVSAILSLTAFIITLTR